MAGCFSLIDDYAHDYHVPPDRLVESHPCADVFALYREGLLLTGASATLQWGQKGSQVAAREAGKIELDGTAVRVSWHKSLPFPVFVCGCGRDCYRLYKVSDIWACRQCHRLDWSSRHRNRTIPGLNRALSLRRRIGAPLVPFSPIAPKLPHATRYWRIVAEIRRLEAGLIQHASTDVNDVLERRHGRSRQHGTGNR